MKTSAVAYMAALCTALVCAAPAPERQPALENKHTDAFMIGPYVIRSASDAAFAEMPEPSVEPLEEIIESPSPDVIFITPTPELHDCMDADMHSNCTKSTMDYAQRMQITPSPTEMDAWFTPTPELESPEPQMF